MKKVLIALDYDPTSKKVAEAGFEMAKAMNESYLDCTVRNGWKIFF